MFYSVIDRCLDRTAAIIIMTVLCWSQDSLFHNRNMCCSKLILIQGTLFIFGLIYFVLCPHPDCFDRAPGWSLTSLRLHPHPDECFSSPAILLQHTWKHIPHKTIYVHWVCVYQYKMHNLTAQQLQAGSKCGRLRHRFQNNMSTQIGIIISLRFPLKRNSVPQCTCVCLAFTLKKKTTTWHSVSIFLSFIINMNSNRTVFY